MNANQTTAIFRAKAIYAAHERDFAASVVKYPINTKAGRVTPSAKA